MLEKSIASGRPLLEKWAELDDNMQHSSKQVLDLIRLYGAGRVETAAQLALENGTPRACSIAQIRAETADEPKQPVQLRLKETLPELKVDRPSTSDYDQLY